MEDYWTPERVRLFDLAVQRSDFPAQVLAALEPLLPECRTALDVGAGVGSLTLPLARRLAQVTALEPSLAMRKALETHVREQALGNVTCVAGEWEKVSLSPHDLILVANVSPVFDALPRFLDEASRIARRAIVLLQNVGPGSEKFYFGELYPLLLGRPYPARPDYLRTVTWLHERGIFANVRVLEYEFDQPFAGFEEAVAFWAQRLRLEAPDQVVRLRRFLEARLRRDGAGCLAPMRRRSALVWWRVPVPPSSVAP